MSAPSILNYAGLQTAVADWPGRGDARYLARVPDFIALGETRIWRRLRVADMIVTGSLIIPGGATNYVTVPADWLEFARVRSSTTSRIEYLPPDQFDAQVLPGDNGFYTVEGRRMIYGMPPNSSATLDVRYYAHPGMLRDVTTTWLLTKAPGAYLYASLLEAMLWSKNASKAGEYGTLLDKELDELESESKASVLGGGRLRAQRPGGFRG